jgi:hypothetical protein
MRRKIPLLIVICLIAFALTSYAKVKYPNLIASVGLQKYTTYKVPEGMLGCSYADGSCDKLGLEIIDPVDNVGLKPESVDSSPACEVFRGAKQACCNVAQSRVRLFLFFEPNYCFIDYMNGDYNLVRP